MNKTRENSKILVNSNKTPKNFTLNKLNLEIKEAPFNLSSPPKNKANSKIFLSSRKNFDKKNLKENYLNKNCDTLSANYRKNKYNKSSYFKDNNKIKDKKSENKKYLLNVGNNNYNSIFKRHLLGNDIILPFNNLRKEFNNSDSNKPFYTYSNFNNFNKLKNIWSPEKKLDNTIKRENSSLIDNNNYKSIDNIKLSYNNKKNRACSHKRIFFSNKNIVLNLYESIEINNSPNKNIKFRFKTQNISNKVDSFTKFKNELTKSKNSKLNFKRKNKSKKGKKLKSKKENYKDEECYNEKEINKYNIVKKLIDNPNSFIYLMFDKIKGRKFDEEGNLLKLDLKKRFSEYKKDLNKLEQKARFELFNLKKQRVIGNEINMKGRVISTNSFFSLAFGGY